VRVVLNRADSKVLLELAEVERAVTGPVVAYIPSDRIVPRSVNKGVPVVLDVPKSSVTKAILGLAKMISANGTKEAADVA
jgi:pilus assembly protein CpaE